ncbi:MAG: hypothetical protein WC505_05475 [Patescibacteria group bacterium]
MQSVQIDVATKVSLAEKAAVALMMYGAVALGVGIVAGMGA